MLAKTVNDNAGILDERGAFGFFASKLAPTGEAGSAAKLQGAHGQFGHDCRRAQLYQP